MRRTFTYTIVLSFTFVLLANNILFAQNGTITGKTKYGKEVLQAATVSLGDKTVLTDQNGEFSFSVKPGNYTIIITHAGYKKMEQVVTVEAASRTNFDFEMIANEQLGEIVMLGSRSVVRRSNLNTAVPVDVFSSVHLAQTGQVSLTQMLNFLAPSFNASREVLHEPVTLRGLDPQHVLILVNGIRYHNMAWLFSGGLKGQLGRGSVGNDLNSIPFSAIEKIEILRDGAAAQYGSDAIAGVINFRLKESTGKTSIQLHTGQYYKGDGEKFSFGLNHGISLNKKGFLNLSASFRYQEPTLRGGEYLGTVYKNYPVNATAADSVRIKAEDDSIINARGFNRKNILDNVGNTKLISAGFLINGGYDIKKYAEIFWTITLNSRKLNRGASFRFPKNPTQVNLALFPDGFQAKNKSNTIDVSLIAGIKGEINKNLHWDFSSSYGSNSVISESYNTNNASQSYMGADAPTSFYTGKDKYNLLTQSINFIKNYSKLPGLLKTLNLGWGVEWRLEKYHSTEGDSASWYNYDPVHYSQGGVGSPGPENRVNKNRNIWGTYIELESEFTSRFFFNAAGRYEYYNDFGGNIAGKFAARYKFSEKLSIRASVSNGFRAPSLQQRYLNSISGSYINSGGILIPALRGTFPNDHQVIKALDIPSLNAEKSINISGGITSTISKWINLTVDAYWIQIKNRIVLSGTLDRSIPAVKKILDSIPGLRVDQVQFFTNAINTTTRGIDIILDGNWNLRKANIGINLAANITATRLFGNIKTSNKLPSDSLNTNTIFNIEEKTRIEKGQPADKIILSITYKKGITGIVISNTRFGKTTIAPVFRNPTRIMYESFSSKILTDISLIYAFKKWITLTLGANNIFDVYPDRIAKYENTQQGSWIYSPEASPFGFNGGYYFVNMRFDF